MRGASWTPGRIAGGALLGLGAFLAIATVRILLDGRRHIEEAERLNREGDPAAAFAALEDAARAYVPGSPYPEKALREMALMARGAHMRGKIDAARERWRSVRRSVLATRHITIPHEDYLARAERQIALLESPSQGAEAKPLERPRDPSPILALLLFAGLVIWISSSAVLASGLGSSRVGGRSRTRTAAWIGSVAGLALWVGMSLLA